MKRPSRGQSALSALGRRIQPPPIAWLMQRALEDPEIVSLAAGFTDNPTLPVREVRRLLEEILRSRRTGEPALQYGTTAGLPELRELTAQRLLALDRTAVQTAPGASIEPDLYAAGRVVITNGSQQLLYLLTEALCDPGDLVLVEAPTYFVYLGIAQGAGLECRGVRRDAEGVDPADLEAVLERLHQQGDLRRLKFLYLVTYHQNPTGTSTRFTRKAAALEQLRRWEKKPATRSIWSRTPPTGN